MMSDNDVMSTEQNPQEAPKDLDRLEQELRNAEPAEAPDAADAIADALSAELDSTGADQRTKESP